MGGNGMLKYHEALKFADVPVPFPYVATAELLLYFHTAVTPIVSVQWSSWGYQPPIFTFLLVFILWSLHIVAGELENPFEGIDANDLDMKQLQVSINSQLLCLVQGPALKLPKLSCTANQAAKRLAAHAKSDFGSLGFSTFHQKSDDDDAGDVEEGRGMSLGARALSRRMFGKTLMILSGRHHTPRQSEMQCVTPVRMKSHEPEAYTFTKNGRVSSRRRQTIRVNTLGHQMSERNRSRSFVSTTSRPDSMATESTTLPDRPAYLDLLRTNSSVHSPRAFRPFSEANTPRSAPRDSCAEVLEHREEEDPVRVQGVRALDPSLQKKFGQITPRHVQVLRCFGDLVDDPVGKTQGDTDHASSQPTVYMSEIT